MKTKFFRTFTFASMLLSAIAFNDWSGNQYAFGNLGNGLDPHQFQQIQHQDMIEELDYSRNFMEMSDDERVRALNDFKNGKSGSEALIRQMTDVRIMPSRFEGVETMPNGDEVLIMTEKPRRIDIAFSFDNNYEMTHSYCVKVADMIGTDDGCKKLIGLLGKELERKELERCEGVDRLKKSNVGKVLALPVEYKVGSVICERSVICEICEKIGTESLYTELRQSGFKKEEILYVYNMLWDDDCSLGELVSFFRLFVDDLIKSRLFDYVKEILYTSDDGMVTFARVYNDKFCKKLMKIGFSRDDIKEKVLKNGDWFEAFWISTYYWNYNKFMKAFEQIGFSQEDVRENILNGKWALRIAYLPNYNLSFFMDELKIYNHDIRKNILNGSWIEALAYAYKSKFFEKLKRIGFEKEEILRLLKTKREVNGQKLTIREELKLLGIYVSNYEIDKLYDDERMPVNLIGNEYEIGVTEYGVYVTGIYDSGKKLMYNMEDISMMARRNPNRLMKVLNNVLDNAVDGNSAPYSGIPYIITAKENIIKILKEPCDEWHSETIGYMLASKEPKKFMELLSRRKHNRSNSEKIFTMDEVIEVLDLKEGYDGEGDTILKLVAEKSKKQFKEFVNSFEELYGYGDRRRLLNLKMEDVDGCPTVEEFIRQ